MTQPASATVEGAPARGLPARVAGVLFSPRDTYIAVAAHPRVLGVLVVVILIMATASYALLSSELGQKIVLDQQVRGMESFGITVTDEMYARLEARIAAAKYTGGLFQAVFVPVLTAAIAGLLTGVFSMLMGGAGTFKQVWAIVAHAGVIVAVQQVFTTVLTRARGQLASANLGVFVPMLEETSFVVRFLSAIDLFVVWWAVSLAIGLGVLYRGRTGGIASALIALYVLIALVVAVFRSGS
jgi:hypothetical protein